MKAIKNLFGFGLLVLMVSVFFTSCFEKEEITDVVVSQKMISGDKFMMPKGIDHENDEEVLTFFNNKTEEELGLMNKNYHIMNYLVDNELYGKVYEELAESELFTDIDLDPYISSEILNDIENYTAQKDEDRGCHYHGPIGHYLEKHPHYCHLKHCVFTYYDNHCSCYASWGYWSWSC